MKLWEYTFLNVEAAVEYVVYNLTTEQIADALSQGKLVLTSVKELEPKVFCYLISGEHFHANGYVCATSPEMAEELVFETYGKEEGDYVDIFEDEELLEGVWVDFQDVEECSCGNC